MSTQLLMSSNHLILCYPFLLLPSIFPTISVFSSESVLHIRWPKYWSFSFSISPSNEYSELISFSIDWLDLLAVQETLKSLLQHRSSKASFLRARAQLLPLALSLEGLCENKTWISLHLTNTRCPSPGGHLSPSSSPGTSDFTSSFSIICHAVFSIIFSHVSILF